jgi:trk system potassium uptake protein
MNIVILGAGEIGAYLAKILSQEEHNIFLIDKDFKRLEKIQQESDISTIHGFGSNWKILNDLIDNQPDLFIAMTGDDETNLVACSIAKNLGYPKTVSRIKEIGILVKSRLDFGRLFFVDHFIGSELIVAQDLLKNILNPSSVAIENFAHGTIQLKSIIVPNDWKNAKKPIKELKLPSELLIALIRRINPDENISSEEKEKIIFPHGDDVILPGDEVTIIGETKIMYDVDELFNKKLEKVKSVAIVGATTISTYLAHILYRHNIQVDLIDKNEKACEEIVRMLPQNSNVFNQDAKNIEFLLSEKMNEKGAFIACTEKDENNLLISLVAKQAKCKKIITLFSDATIGSIMRELNISFSLSEKVNIINRILSLIHAKTAIAIASLCDNKARVIELKVSKDSEVVGIPLSELSVKLPKDLIIAAIENRGQVMIGKGDRIISPHDTIIVITSPKYVAQLQDIF